MERIMTHMVDIAITILIFFLYSCLRKGQTAASAAALRGGIRLSAHLASGDRRNSGRRGRQYSGADGAGCHYLLCLCADGGQRTASDHCVYL